MTPKIPVEETTAALRKIADRVCKRFPTLNCVLPAEDPDYYRGFEVGRGPAHLRIADSRSTLVRVYACWVPGAGVGTGTVYFVAVPAIAVKRRGSRHKSDSIKNLPALLYRLIPKVADALARRRRQKDAQKREDEQIRRDLGDRNLHEAVRVTYVESRGYRLRVCSTGSSFIGIPVTADQIRRIDEILKGND